MPRGGRIVDLIIFGDLDKDILLQMVLGVFAHYHVQTVLL